MALYRVGALDELAARADIDWPTVRATGPRRMSPLGKLLTARSDP